MRLDPFAAPYCSDPAATWHAMHASRETVFHDSDLNLWVIAGYEQVRAALLDATTFSNAATLNPITRPAPTAWTMLVAAFKDLPTGAITADPPQHTRMREVLRQVFPTTPKLVEQRWGALVTRTAERLVNAPTCAMRRAPNARKMVRTTGNSSGSNDMPTAIATRAASSQSRRPTRAPAPNGAYVLCPENAT